MIWRSWIPNDSGVLPTWREKPWPMRPPPVMTRKTIWSDKHKAWNCMVFATDLGSGMNDHPKGLKLLLNDILADRIGRLVVTHKDRL
jgi:hypothetical protein